ncbi:MAG: HAD family phosphatase [Aggregatilineales bacterium]|nr:HAD family phosphatase [Aggregatilineales bacterium]HPV05905.1 HAD family phosphatase [Aggregatilineales bacterium]
MTRRAVIFDWGGVLMRTEDYSPRHAWDARLGMPTGHVESVVHGIEAWQQAQRGEISVDAYWQAVGRELGLDGQALAELRAGFYSGDRLNTALVELIRDLRTRGVLIGLLSNNTPDLTDALLEHQVHNLFDAQVISAEIGVMKPDPRPYELILQKLDVQPADALFVDDFIENVEAARTVGMAAVHYRPGMDLRREIEVWLGETTGNTRHRD